MSLPVRAHHPTRGIEDIRPLQFLPTQAGSPLTPLSPGLLLQNFLDAGTFESETPIVIPCTG